MAEQRTFEVGNALIVLLGESDPFSEGADSGYLEFYDDAHRPPFPLTSQVVCDHLRRDLEGTISPCFVQGWTDCGLDRGTV